MQNPLVSVITVVYNGEKTIKDTIESVLNQMYNNIEYIIIDGNSTDNTLKIIKEYEEKFKEKGMVYKWISEPDNGIYDAMNKGIYLANGKWINFMNSGDLFYNNAVLDNIFLNNNLENVDVIYGNTHILGENPHITKPRPLNTFYMCIPFCHQSSFTKTDLLRNNNFNLNYRLCSDFDFFYGLYLENKIFKYINQVISKYDASGVSSNNPRVFSENKLISLKKKKRLNILFFL